MITTVSFIIGMTFFFGLGFLGGFKVGYESCEKDEKFLKKIHAEKEECCEIKECCEPADLEKGHNND